ncbi:MAG: hypothetical protein UU81_C0017G0003 [Microgenomates group bacterium GW2011_GWC1_41_8]|uniref:Uncharacterized protein n=2 Tax=Candidatus Roizmaniibacteriota TaxID=1752723 RepID=A0A0G0VH77_9BACT|nr:MAG: hypothetical protein UU14_C0029G0009 [Candidatus Roizmanbacteria bacterium GW2011_GWB1_40_7]KKR92175.1 MAG: hypothetical protein UU41_C0028G0008 [Candidatus Roizmanbacteria bacterium GW2011_GWA1_41_13]KKS23831.1 MAG: hypothetical protein UU81_C0017G0003 [Microgenomates group bacterium GW2011_GWC1_41_8]
MHMSNKETIHNTPEISNHYAVFVHPQTDCGIARPQSRYHMVTLGMRGLSEQDVRQAVDDGNVASPTCAVCDVSYRLLDVYPMIP